MKVTRETRIGRSGAWLSVVEAAEMGNFPESVMLQAVEVMLKSGVLHWVRDENRVVASYRRRSSEAHR